MASRLEEITLGDFKEAIDRPGIFRYHFKALDPEFGTVKEEVCSIELGYNRHVPANSVQQKQCHPNTLFTSHT